MRLLIIGLFSLTIFSGCSDDSSRVAMPEINALSLTAGVTTRVYPSQSYSAVRTSGESTWTIFAGSLPRGMSLSSAGVLSGTPTEAGDFQFTISVTDARGLSSSLVQQLRIIDPEFGIITSNIDRDGDGNNEAVSTLTFLNASNQIVESRTEDFSTNEVYVYSYIYDNAGNRIREEYSFQNELLYLTHYMHDANGNETRIERDAGADGTINQIVERTYDANGFVVLQRVDYEGDAIFDLEQTWIYSPAAPGHWTSRSNDINADGIINFYEEWQFDPVYSRRELHIDQDTDGDTIWDAEMFISWTDNADGSVTRLLQRDLDRDSIIDRTDRRVILNGGDMLPFERVRYSTLYERDTDADGQPDYIETNTFDSSQRLTSYAQDTDGDGLVEFQTNLTYEVGGNLIHFENSNGYLIDVTYTDWVLGTYDLLDSSERGW